jgi:hypothetical protein
MEPMLKNDTVFIPDQLISGNELIVSHPGSIDPSFFKQLATFLLDFEYEFFSIVHNIDEDFTTITFEWKGVLEDEDESEALRARMSNDL